MALPKSGMAPVDGAALDDFLWTPLRTPWRWPLAAATVVTAAAHLPVIEPHLHEAPYMGEEFVVLTVACLLLGCAALVCDSRAVYGAAVLTCGLALVGYMATRLIAFPLLAGDVGDWLEPLGVVSVLAESVASVAAVNGLWGAAPRRRRASPRRHGPRVEEEQLHQAAVAYGVPERARVRMEQPAGQEHEAVGPHPARIGGANGIPTMPAIRSTRSGLAMYAAYG